MKKRTKPAPRRRTPPRRRAAAPAIRPLKAPPALRPVADLIDEAVREDGADRDELVLAAILAGGHTSGRKIQPHNSRQGVRGSGNLFGITSSSDSEGPVCAVGAGVIYSGLPCVDVVGPTRTFAEAYGVSPGYADGVSHGFERAVFDADSDLGRGSEVGNAAFVALYGDEEDLTVKPRGKLS